MFQAGLTWSTQFCHAKIGGWRVINMCTRILTFPSSVPLSGKFQAFVYPQLFPALKIPVDAHLLNVRLLLWLWRPSAHSCPAHPNKLRICDVIKQNESEVANTVFKIQLNKAISFFCFLLFLQSFNWLYLQNQLPSYHGVFTKLKRK